MTPHAAPPAFAGHELPRRFRSTNADDRKLCVDVSSLNREQNAHYRKVSDLFINCILEITVSPFVVDNCSNIKLK